MNQTYNRQARRLFYDVGEKIEKNMGIKENKKFSGKKILLILVIVLAFFIVVRIFVIPQLGQWLVVNDEVKESDVILVLMGSVYDKII